MYKSTSLNKVEPGQTAIVRSILIDGGMRRRLLDIGLIRNTEVECVGRSPAGDPSAYMIRGSLIAIRAADSVNIIVTLPAALPQALPTAPVAPQTNCAASADLVSPDFASADFASADLAGGNGAPFEINKGI